MINTDDCWLYAGSINSNGYGLVFGSKNSFYAHRTMYENTKGEIGKSLQVDHLCMIRRCINPIHLEAVTRKENILRGNGIAAISARKTHCKHGHPFDASNTTITKRGRECKTCKQAINQRYYAKRML